MADITFASLAFPVILPEETASVFVEYDPRFLPRGYVETIKRYQWKNAETYDVHVCRMCMLLKDGRTKPSLEKTVILVASTNGY